MPTLLVMTVGGSCAPVVTAIRDYAPDFVAFIVTVGSRGSRSNVDGAGHPCGDPRTLTCPDCGAEVRLGDPKGANIITQTDLAENSYTLLELSDPDALPEAYTQIRALLTQLSDEREGWRRVADYTGGTKSMTVALALAALETGYELSLVKGARADLIKVRDGTEMAGLVNAGEVRARRRLAEAQRLFNAYAYASAGELLQNTLRAALLPSALQAQIRELVILCRGFDAWDRFDHQRAFLLLEPCQSRVVRQWIFLKRLVGRAPGYAPVLDLLRNAERRAARGRYDDAVARLYRALELLAQTRMSMREPRLNSSDLDITALPENLREPYAARQDAKGTVKLGLRDDYLLLEALDDPLGRVHCNYGNRLLNILSLRNQSILAHGTEPINEVQWQQMVGVVTTFMEAGMQALDVRLDAPQFPNLEF